jgi:hypothetical protein
MNMSMFSIAFHKKGVLLEVGLDGTVQVVVKRLTTFWIDIRVGSVVNFGGERNETRF